MFDADGGPIPWPIALAGDGGYRADWIDQYLLDLELRPVIPSQASEDRNARPVDFDPESYSRSQHHRTTDRLAEAVPSRADPIREDGRELPGDDPDGLHPASAIGFTVTSRSRTEPGLGPEGAGDIPQRTETVRAIASMRSMAALTFRGRPPERVPLVAQCAHRDRAALRWKLWIGRGKVRLDRTGR